MRTARKTENLNRSERDDDDDDKDDQADENGNLEMGRGGARYRRQSWFFFMGQKNICGHFPYFEIYPRYETDMI